MKTNQYHNYKNLGNIFLTKKKKKARKSKRCIEPCFKRVFVTPSTHVTSILGKVLISTTQF